MVTIDYKPWFDEVGDKHNGLVQVHVCKVSNQNRLCSLVCGITHSCWMLDVH